MTPAAAHNMPLKAYVTWGLRLLSAFVFFVPAITMLGGNEIVNRQFEAAGIGETAKLAIVAVQLVGALLVLFPATSLIAAIALLLLDAGALVFQASVPHGDIIHVILFALPLLALISLETGRFDMQLLQHEKHRAV